MATFSPPPAIVPVILCGGAGVRLWPMSREGQPKQFLNLTGESSLLQETAQRVLRISQARPENLIAVTLEKLEPETARHLKALDPMASWRILREPCARNTAPAIALAAFHAREIYGEDAILWVSPSDHHIDDDNALGAALAESVRQAKRGSIATFGIRPTRPETGYGYIQFGPAIADERAYEAASFVEKPDIQTARAFMDSGEYAWNSGMFVFQVKTILEEFTALAPDIFSEIEKAVKGGLNPPPEIYAALPSISFDKAIMEKSRRVAVIPCEAGWSDVGSWQSLWEIRSKDMNDNVIEGRAACRDTRGCLILSKDQLVACAGVENLAIVVRDDAILIANRNDAAAMKSLAETLKESGSAAEDEGDQLHLFDRLFPRQAAA